MAEAVRQRALRPRRAVNYAAEGACETPLWLNSTKTEEAKEAEMNALRKRAQKKEGKTRARISKDKENVRNPQANVVKKTIPEDVVIADDSADTKKRKVTAGSDKSEKPLKRITKRNTAAPVPGPTHPKQVSEAAAAEAAHATIQRHRANTTSRVKTFSLEEVSKITDMDDEFDEDDMPEVQMPPPSRAAPKPTTKARAAPKPAEAPKPTIVEKATVTSKVASRAPRKPSVPSEAVGQHFDTDDADTKSYLDLLESYNALQKKYTQMKNNKLDEAQAHSESVDKNIKDHAKAHVELAENWKGEALRLAEVNKQAGAKETLDKLKQLSTENAELKRLIARAELRDIELTRKEEQMQNDLDEAQANALRAEERASKAESQSHDVLQSAEHRIHATNLRFAEYKKQAAVAQEQSTRSEEDLRREIATLRGKIAVADEQTQGDKRLFHMLTGMQRRDFMSAGCESSSHEFRHRNSGFAFRISIPDMQRESEVTYEMMNLGTAVGRLPEYFEDESISFSSSQLSAFFSKMLHPLQKCPPLKKS